MNPRLRIPLFIIGVITVFVIAIFVLPRGLSLYYQIKGGQHIDYVLRFEEGIQELVCEPLLPTEEARNEVEQGIADLNRAIRINKNNAQAYYYLGKAHCLLGGPERAKENYLHYTELRPENPLGFIGLGFAYEATCLNKQKAGNEFSSEIATAQKSVCDITKYQSLIQQAWEEYGLQSNDFLFNANSQFDQKRYADALQWYSLGYRSGAIQLEELSITDALNWAISAALSEGPLPNELYPNLPVLVFEDPIQIEVEDMRWLKSIPEWDLYYGDPVNKFPSITDGVGTLFWNGRVVSIVQILESGNYKFIVRGINSSPAPIILTLEDNFHPLYEIRFEKGDQSFEDITIQSFLNEGIHVISLNFLNNGVVGGVDRDAQIDFTKISKIPD